MKLKRNYNLSAPKGVNGRNSDNTLILEKLDWAPSIKLREGIRAEGVDQQEMLAAKPLAAATR